MSTLTPAFGSLPNVTFFAKRTLAITNGLVDCGARAGACILMATSDGNVGGGAFVSTVTNGLAAASKHPSVRAAASIPTNLSPQTLHAAARSTICGVE